MKDCIEAHGKRPAAYLDELGFLGPRTVLAHGVWLDEAELELIAERGATVVASPAANMKLAVGGVLPYPAASRAGVRLGLGTDGVSSNSNLDSFEEVKLFALSQKHATGDPSTLPAGEALAIARGLSLAGARRHAARARAARRLSPAARLRSRALRRRPRRGPGLRGGRLGGRHHRGRGPGPDAGPGRARRRRAGGGGPRPSRAPHRRDDRVRPVRTQARFPDVPEKAGHYESFYLKLTQPGGGRAAWIRHTVHKRPGEQPTCALWFVLFDADARRAARHQAPVRRRRAQRPTGLLHPRGRRKPRRRARERPDRDAGARCQLGPDLLRRPRALPPSAARLPLPRAAPQDQVPEPLPGRGLRRGDRAGRRADRGRGLARHDRPQLGRRARRALGLGPGLGLRGPLAGGLLRHGGRPDQGRRRARRPGSATRC